MANRFYHRLQHGQATTDRSKFYSDRQFWVLTVDDDRYICGYCRRLCPILDLKCCHLNVEGLIGGFGSVGIKLVWRLE